MIGAVCPTFSARLKGGTAVNATIELLGRQHQEVLARLAAVESGFSACGASGELIDFVSFLEREVASHFTVEEEALFPVLGRHLGFTQGPLAVMLAEHKAFRELMHDLSDAVRSGDVEQQRARTLDLIESLRGHIAKEDNVLFPMALRMLTAEEHREVDGLAAAVDAL